MRRRRCHSTESGQFIDNGKEHLLMNALVQFYRQKDRHIEILVFFLKNKQRRLSLRLLDWLVTNYAKKYGVVINNTSDHNNTEFMYLAYKNHLKSYSKKYFDAFARRQRVFYMFDHTVKRITNDDILNHVVRDDGIITTIAQLNAFRFFITCGVIEYAINHLDDIERDMIGRDSSLPNPTPVVKTASVFNTFVISRFRLTVQFK